MRNRFEVDLITGLSLILDHVIGLRKAWNVDVFEDRMNAELFFGTLPEAIRVYVRFESLSFIQHVLVPCQTYSLSVFDVGHCENCAHLVSNFDRSLDIENLVRCFS